MARTSNKSTPAPAPKDGDVTFSNTTEQTIRFRLDKWDGDKRATSEVVFHARPKRRPSGIEPIWQQSVDADTLKQLEAMPAWERLISDGVLQRVA